VGSLLTRPPEQATLDKFFPRDAARDADADRPARRIAARRIAARRIASS
jgi:hypothetical protein